VSPIVIKSNEAVINVMKNGSICRARMKASLDHGQHIRSMIPPKGWERNAAEKNLHEAFLDDQPAIVHLFDLIFDCIVKALNNVCEAALMSQVPNPLHANSRQFPVTSFS
jgi:hypothetical protein